MTKNGVFIFLIEVAILTLAFVGGWLISDALRNQQANDVPKVTKLAPGHFYIDRLDSGELVEFSVADIIGQDGADWVDEIERDD